MYENEEVIGEALQELFKEGVVKRSDMFITTKVRCVHCDNLEETMQLPPAYMRPELVREAFDRSLKRLQLDYIDLYLIHNPMPAKVNCHSHIALRTH